MHPVLDEFLTTAGWLCIFAPMVLAGLVAAMDPSGFRALLDDFGEGVHRVVAHLRTSWQLPMYEWRAPAEPSPGTDVTLRLAGAAVVALGLLGLWAVLR